MVMVCPPFSFGKLSCILSRLMRKRDGMRITLLFLERPAVPNDSPASSLMMLPFALNSPESFVASLACLKLPSSFNVTVQLASACRSAIVSSLTPFVKSQVFLSCALAPTVSIANSARVNNFFIRNLFLSSLFASIKLTEKVRKKS